MPTPRISRSMWEEAHETVARHGSLLGAARAIGIPVGTLEKRYFRAIENGMPEVRTAPKAVAHPHIGKASLIERPHIPSKHEPVQDLIDRRKREFERRRAHNQAKDWARYKIKENGPFALAFFGDPHIDDDGCDIGALENDLDTMDRTPGVYGVGLGDWCNAWTGRLSRLYSQQGTTEHQAFRMAEWMLSRPSWLLLLRGNHDMWHGAASPILWMANGASIEDWSARFEVVGSGSRAWRFWAAHDFPGSSMWNKAHAPMRRAQQGQEADFYICGHRHSFTLVQDQDDHTGRVYWAARARGYKAIDSYATVLGYGSSGNEGRTITAVCDPSTGKMHAHADLQDAVERLSWLRNR